MRDKKCEWKMDLSVHFQAPLSVTEKAHHCKNNKKANMGTKLSESA